VVVLVRLGAAASFLVIAKIVFQEALARCTRPWCIPSQTGGTICGHVMSCTLLLRSVWTGVAKARTPLPIHEPMMGATAPL
jgi:hypothetical protein